MANTIQLNSNGTVKRDSQIRYMNALNAKSKKEQDQIINELAKHSTLIKFDETKAVARNQTNKTRTSPRIPCSVSVDPTDERKVIQLSPNWGCTHQKVWRRFKNCYQNSFRAALASESASASASASESAPNVPNSSSTNNKRNKTNVNTNRNFQRSQYELMQPL